MPRAQKHAVYAKGAST